MARTRPSHEFVTRTATREDAKKFGLRDYASFHYFNPNGAHQQFQDEYRFLLYEVVSEKIVPSGWLLAYNADVFEKQLARITMSKAFPNKIKLQVAVDLIDREREQLNRLLNEKFDELEAAEMENV